MMASAFGFQIARGRICCERVGLSRKGVERIALPVKVPSKAVRLFSKAVFAVFNPVFGTSNPVFGASQNDTGEFAGAQWSRHNLVLGKRGEMKTQFGGTPTKCKRWAQEKSEYAKPTSKAEPAKP